MDQGSAVTFLLAEEANMQVMGVASSVVILTTGVTDALKGTSNVVGEDLKPREAGVV